MLPAPPRQRLTLPAPPAPPARSAFPLAATLAPVVVSIVLWMLTQSIYSLLFAVLGPVVAVGGLIDGRVGRRRASRRDRARYVAALARTADAVAAAHAVERERLWGLVPVPSASPWADARGAAVPVMVGRGALPGRMDLGGDDPDEGPDDVVRAVARVREAAATLRDAPILVDAREGIGITGPPVLAAAVARALAVQLASRLSPADVAVSAPASETWAEHLPHTVGAGEAGRYSFREGDDDPLVVAWAEGEPELPLGCGVLIFTGARLRSAPGVRVTGVRPVEVPLDVRYDAVTSAEAVTAAEVMRARATARGLRPLADRLPLQVPLSELSAGAPEPERGALTAPIGRDAEGLVIVDLVADGPHAVIAGTTGSGKSELLVSWILGMAAGRSPDDVAFLLVDFKGGSAFAPLAVLPHVLATLSDLDTRLTHRAIDSLRAELLHRERVLASAGARSIEDLAPGTLPRLVIVVDEFAAVVSSSPELHEVFGDLAARGRSLGLHLILCTQRPAGVIRDAVLANVTLRMSLRVTDRADSVAMLGSDAAARLPAEPRGRGILLRDGVPGTLQIAIARPEDAHGIAGRTPPSRIRRPWCEPLPRTIALESLPPAEHGLAFGLLDLPAEQRQPVAAYDPSAHGHLLVVGGSGAGSSTVLAALVASAVATGAPVSVVPADPADAWAVVVAETQRPAGTGRLIVLDDLDALIARFDPDYRHEFLELLTGLARRSGTAGPSLAVSVHRLTGPMTGVAGLFGSRLLLRQASREEHVLAGGDPRAFDPDLPAGAGTWRGTAVQVALPSDAERRQALAAPGVEQAPPRPVPVRMSEHRVLAVVAARPRAHLEMFRATGARIIELGDSPSPQLDELRLATGPTPTVLLGDPEAWLAEWAILASARRDWPIVLLDVTAADHRALLRDRALPPPLGPASGECWLAADGRTVRAKLAPA
ncbi:MAG: FtsK/SpoIIIE domain-containing protein [Pseudolysinimonas sp.]